MCDNIIIGPTCTVQYIDLNTKEPKFDINNFYLHYVATPYKAGDFRIVYKLMKKDKIIKIG